MDNSLFSYSLRVPAGWSGRIWGHHECSFNASGRGSCATGDCGGSLYCNGLGGVSPATLAEITLGEEDFYDVSLVDGYNIAVSITPFRGKGKCSRAGCISDLNAMCPAGLQVKSHDNKVVACKTLGELPPRATKALRPMNPLTTIGNPR
ncbi:thaumatin-like protein [Telopea speciosissima]|uniref:thaumatin-like protein n=1 Tax=Telopea speciosissima TaxID=54955 RepID=UPI001CC7EB1A|nr:thaumatin-like protein [Telopea speciosissima]